MSDETKQAVVDTSAAPATPDATDNSARDTEVPLEQLLAEYDQKVAPAAPVSPPATPPEQPQEPPLNPRLKRLEDRLFQEDLNEAVTNVFGDMKIPRRAARGWLEVIAMENPAIGLAFVNKDRDPKTWQRFQHALRKEAQEEFKSFMVDDTATADREAVAAAMRGASTKVAAEPAPKFGHMSNAEYRKSIREQYGFDPGV